MVELLKNDNKNSGQINKLLARGHIQEIWGLKKWKNLFAPVDISSQVFFRILFGTLMLFHIIDHFDNIERYWILPKYHFYYWPFDFIEPLSGNGMYILFIFMGILSAFIIVGLFYRLSITLFFLSFSYTFLLEQARYLNHYYLIILVSFIMIFLPLNKSISLDNKIYKKNSSETSPAWSLWLLRFMIAIPYFFGGIAKLNNDWLHGEPLRMWLNYKSEFFTFGSLFQSEVIVLLYVYSGLLLDLLIIPAFLFKKTRTMGFLIIVVFHLINSLMFTIGIFPWFMIAASTLFFNPDWFRNKINFFSRKGSAWPMVIFLKEKLTPSSLLIRKQKLIIFMLSIWVTFQLFLPFRHYFFSGNVSWTEEGHKYAWHMKLRSKNEIGYYTAIDKNSGKIYDIKVYKYLKSWQRNKMEDRPYLIWQFGQIVKKDFKERGIDIAFFANIKASLNGRKYQQFIDSTVDLTSVPSNILSHSNWIVPLKTPLNDRLSNEQIRGLGITSE